MFLLVSVSTVLFFLLHVIPGDPALNVLGEGAHITDIEQVRKDLNLDKPLMQQYLEFQGNLLNLTFGRSMFNRRTVSANILSALPNTVYLALFAMLLAFIFSFPSGLLAAYKENKAADAWVTFFSSIGTAIPNFLLGPLLIIFFAIHLKWLPVSGDRGFTFILLPALTLGLSMSAFLCRITKNAVAGQLKQGYVLFARAKGLSEFQIFRRHVLKNSLIPIVTTMGLQLGALLTGTIITETIFSWRGIGSLLIQSINRRDYPMVQGIIIFMTLIYLLTSLLVDVLYFFLDPRIRYEAV